jgi:hypothetical protein
VIVPVTLTVVERNVTSENRYIFWDAEGSRPSKDLDEDPRALRRFFGACLFFRQLLTAAADHILRSDRKG